MLRLLGFWPAIACILLVATVLGPSVSAPQNSLAPATYSTSDWLNWARTAWRYYQPGVGVDSASGLHRATLTWNCFTDWDLGTYIFSIIFARKLNLISDGSGSGDWQFTDRINRVFTFLQNRPLSGPTPYWAYDWATGTPCSETASKLSDGADQARLLGALHALTAFRPNYASQVASIFARSHSAYDTFFTELGTNYYDYFFAEGYAAFGYNESRVFNAIDNYSGPFLNVYGQSLPLMKTGAEPLDLEILEGTYAIHPPSSSFLSFANEVSLAQAGRFASTNLLTAWSEGAYSNPDYIYEWIIVNTGGWQTWTLASATQSIIKVPPLAFTKVAFSYLAIYGETPYTLALVNATKQLASSQGFGEGTFENGVSAMSLWGSNTGGFYTDKTNEQVLAAAVYAVSHTIGYGTTFTTTSSPLLSSTSTYATSSGSTVGSTISTSASNPISTPITGFSWATIIVGIILGLSVLVLRRGRRLGRTHSLGSKYSNVEAKPSDGNVLSLGA